MTAFSTSGPDFLAPTPLPSQAPLADLLEQHPEGIVYFDSSFRIVFANAVARRISRILPEHILTQTHWELYPATVGTEVEAVYRRVLADRQPETIPDFLYTPFNTWYRVRAIPLADGFAIYYQDVTEEHHLAQQKQATEDRLSFALATANGIGTWDWDIVHDLVYSDPNFARIYGVSAEAAAQGTSIADFTRNVHPEDAAPVGELIAAVLKTGGDFFSEYRLLQADGSVRWVAARGRVLLADDGTPLRFPGVTIDITEQKERDEQLRVSQERYRLQYEEIDHRRRELEAIYSGSPIGMAIYEPRSLKLMHINERQAEIFGLTKAEALGKTFSDLVAGINSSLPLIRRAADGEAVLDHNITGTLDRYPGEIHSWNVNYTPIFGEDGTVQAVASATIETTNQKRAETALVQAEKLAAVGRLASSIAHEINNPLEAVTNLIFLSRQYAIVPEVQEFLDLAEQELRRVSVIANQTLRFHKQATNPTECDSADLFDSTLSLYEGRLRNADIQVQRRFRDHPAFHCFEGDIRQVLSNLIGNAIDALPRSGRLLLRSRRATNWKTNTPGITLTIADTGAGIPAASRAHIFEAFYTTKGFNGTGLGLWVSADIVARHHGSLRVRSSQAAGRSGTVFTLFIPLNSTSEATQ